MAINNSAQITPSYKQALVLQGKGQLESALKIYSDILSFKPDIAEIHFQIGKIFFLGNRFSKSVFHFQIASELKPTEAAIWSEYINSLLCSGDGAAIKSASKQLKKSGLDKRKTIELSKRLLNTASKHSINFYPHEKKAVETVQTALDAKSFAQANSLAKGYYTKYKDSALIAELLARTHSYLLEFDVARDYFRQALTLKPDFFNAAKNFAKSEFEAKNYDGAAAAFKTAIQIAPRSVTAFIGLSQVLVESDRKNEAVELLMNVGKLAPRDGKIDRELGRIAVTVGALSNAVDCLTAAQKKGDRSVQMHIDLGNALVAAREFDRAMDEYQTAQELEPNNHVIFYRQSLALLGFGKIDDAIVKIKHAMTLAPEGTNYLLLYVSMRKFEAGDPIIDELIEFYENPESSIFDQTELAFSISKVLEDSKQYDRVFPYLKAANDSVLERFPYDENHFEREIDDICDYFSEFKLLDFKGMGNEAAAPIFVCGMPRSGTTLVEQIVSSHSRVSGAGEVGFAHKVENRMLKNSDGTIKKLHELGRKELTALANEVDSYLSSLFDEPDRVSDKSIGTYKRMGLLKAAMPNCKIIVLRRDPRDNLLSIYRNRFIEGTHRYAYNLSHLGAYYKQFVRVIDFWRETMPEGFMEIQYEDLIGDPEKYARALIDYCDLEWEDNCLNFHKSKRQVKTLSVFQVRQPIYKSSVKAWQRYEEHLQPLFEALK